MSSEAGKPARKLLRSRIEKQLQKQQEEARRDLLRKRIEIAKEGAKLYESGRTIEAVKKYHQYLYILEMWKKCGKDGIHPDLFDRQKDIYELVLISGVYWDLSLLYDLAKRLDQKDELKLCLDKFVKFSKGFPYQPLSGEALRRYLGSGKCRHRDEFKKAYQDLTGEKCFIATSLLDETRFETIDRLRAFRDETLSRSAAGRAFVRAYYWAGPAVARALNRSAPLVRRCLGRSLDHLATWLRA